MRACGKCCNRHSLQGKEAGKAQAELALTGSLKDKREFAKESRQGRGNSNMKGTEVKKHQIKVCCFQRLGTEAWLKLKWEERELWHLLEGCQDNNKDVRGSILTERVAKERCYFYKLTLPICKQSCPPPAVYLQMVELDLTSDGGGK